MKQIIIYKGRTNVIPISFGFDISNDIITSEIRTDKKSTSPLIATFDFAFESDGTDGKGSLILDNSVTSGITRTIGYMDVKRVSNGEPLPVFDEPLEVIFKFPVTA